MLGMQAQRLETCPLSQDSLGKMPGKDVSQGRFTSILKTCPPEPRQYPLTP